MNPLLEVSSLEFEAIDFSKVTEDMFLPALDMAINNAYDSYNKIKLEKECTFENVIVASEAATDQLDLVIEIFYALHSAHCTDALSDIAEEFNKKLTAFSSNISLDEDLFKCVKMVYDNKDKMNLSKEQLTVLENHYLDFTRNGALLSDKDKEKLREIDQKLSLLSLKFSENLRKANNAYTLFVTEESRLKGLSEDFIKSAKKLSEEKGQADSWAITLDYPSYLPFMQYCEDRNLRKELWETKITLATSGEFDNSQVLKEILTVRLERAKLIGYEDHPSFVLDRRMAKNADNVLKFLDDIYEKALPFAKKDLEKLENLKEELTGDRVIRKYDTAFYTEKLKKKELDFDDEVLRPYFKLENVLEGAFAVAEKLYGIQFIERNDIPKYYEEVKVFEVKDENGEFLGLFYGDFFPRKEKRSGAWMTVFRNAGLNFGKVRRPFVCNVGNLTKPTADKPSLLTLDEVRTIFHELGHGLHGLLSKVKYKSIAGTSVFWDFVELPSQVMENWLTEKECLDLFARHYQTGELIPEELILKIKKSEQFLEGLGTLKQLGLARLDMDWHLADPTQIGSISKFETQSGKPFNLFPEEGIESMSCSFGHIFAGGYSSGYYSYKWAEVLDADAFSYFKENGIFNKEIGTSFRTNILEKGGAEDPMKLYEQFRGHSPNSDALMKRCGFVN